MSKTGTAAADAAVRVARLRLGQLHGVTWPIGTTGLNWPRRRLRVLLAWHRVNAQVQGWLIDPGGAPRGAHASLTLEQEPGRLAGAGAADSARRPGWPRWTRRGCGPVAY